VRDIDSSSGFSRREALAAGLAIGSMPSLLAAQPVRPADEDRLWYDKPAAGWTAALPIGNGRLGAMVFGRVGQERLQLNESTLWAGAPYDPDNPEALAALPQVRALLAAGKYREATDMASARMMGRPLTQMPYGTLGDIFLTFTSAQTPTEYRRELDLASAIAATRFATPAGRYMREVFASAPDRAIVMRLEAETGTLDFDLAYRAPREIKLRPEQFTGDATPAEIAADWLMREEAGQVPPDVSIAADGPGALLITGRNEAVVGIPAGLRYALRVHATGDGVIVTSEKGLSVRGARRVTVLIAAATSYIGYGDIAGDPVGAVRGACEAAGCKPYETLRRDHIADHAALYGGFGIDLGTSPAAGLPTDRRISASAATDDPALAALYLQYGRYLLISSSRPGGQPANLQGIWNEGTSPPWGSKYTININTEMNYWPADPAGLGRCVEPLLRMTEELSIAGARTARTMYGARGWVAHHNTDLWRASAPIDGPLWGLWPCGGAWLCNTLFTHWDHVRDDGLLARLYPLLKGASRFFLDTLIEDPKGRGLVTSPSLSPENEHPFGSSLCVGPAMDRQIVRDLFGNTLIAGRQLARDADWLEDVNRARAALAPDRIGKAGQLQEWLEDWDEQAPDLHHRHVSHLYGVYPSGQINLRDTPELIEAAKVSLRARGDLSTGWATAWRVCLWARMGEGDHAHAVLKGLLGPTRTYPNMFDAHPPFQIDGNFGGAAGIMEMLLQSWGGALHVLPALPSAWPAGAIAGFRARGGVSVDLQWAHRRPTTLVLHGKPGSALEVRAGGEHFAAEIGASGQYRRNWK